MPEIFYQQPGEEKKYGDIPGFCQKELYGYYNILREQGGKKYPGDMQDKQEGDGVPEQASAHFPPMPQNVQHIYTHEAEHERLCRQIRRQPVVEIVFYG